MKHDEEMFKEKISELTILATKKRSKQLSFWAVSAEKKLKLQDESVEVNGVPLQDEISVGNAADSEATSSTAIDQSGSHEPQKKFECPAENKLKKNLQDIKEDITYFNGKQQNGLGDSDAINKELKSLSTEKTALKKNQEVTFRHSAITKVSFEIPG